MTMTLDPTGADAVQLDLPFHPESAGVARSRLQQWMGALGDVGELGECADDARLLISELVGNAVRHARPLGSQTSDEVLRVAWSRSPERTLVIAVTDGGADTAPQVHSAAAGDTCGRGLGIVAHLARRWWVEGSHDGVTVHAELPLR